MKNLLIVSLFTLSVLILAGTIETPSTPSTSSSRAVIELPVPKPAPDLPPVEHPVVIQVNHQGFPFDLNGNFPYVVMIDNQVYRYNREAVIEFLEKAVIPEQTNNLRFSPPIQ